MRLFTLQVFSQTATEQRLRLLDDQGNLLGERSLPQADIERFVTEVEKDYRASKLDLSALGRRLYEWLDGPTERWLATLRAQHPNLALHVDVESRLRHLPWELLYGDAYLCGHPHHRFTPVRQVNHRRDSGQPANRPLRVLFMASSPENVLPVLDFETEEARILEATRRRPLELMVEESGSLEGLREQVTAVEAGYFDVFHLTGHADIRAGKPVFILEDPLGFKREADADQLAEAFSHHWPRLLFLSGCRTGQSLEQGELPSLCEALVQAGAPAVLGWALPVGDRDASQAAAYLYEQLAGGERLDAAVAHARQQLLAKDDSRYWHLLRLYANATPLSDLVTPLKTKGRAPLMVREARAEFLDAAGKVEVCPRDRFVGRRRPLQRCLRVLKSFAGEDGYAEGVLLHGMGGLGKSSLAARLCDRLPDYRRLVWVGQVDELALLRVLGDKLDDAKAITRLNEPGLSLKARLQRLLRETLATVPMLFVFDDFEHSLDRNEEGNVSLKPGTLPVLRDLLAALHETGSACRVIVTSRWAFPLPGPAKLYSEGLESLRGADLEKKTQQLESLGAEAKIAATIKERALTLAAGNPRLLEWLDRAIQDQATDETALLAALEKTEAQFREDVLLEQLVEQQTEMGRRLLAFLALYQLPVPESAVAAVVDGPLPEADMRRAVNLGLVEAGRDPATTEPRYYVSPLLDMALREELNDTERLEASRRAARHLYQIWWKASAGIDEAQELEIHRLALQAGEAAIVSELADVIASRWVYTARYREAERLCQDSLLLGEDYRLLHNLARAEEVLGKTDQAKHHYEAALAGCPEINAETEKDIVSGYAAIQHNLAGLLNQRGDIEGALSLWRDSLDLSDQIGDVKGKAATLHQMAGVIAQRGDIEGALSLWRDSLDLWDQIGNVQGKAATLNNMAGVIAQRGDIEGALSLWRDSLDLSDQIGDVKGKAATLHQMAGVIAQRGDIEGALSLWRDSLDLSDQIGDVKGKAATLHQMAGVIAQRGDIEGALSLWRDSLDLWDQIGDVQGKAATLHEMAGVIAQRGDIEGALSLWRDSLDLKERIGDVKGKAATLHQMAGVIAQRGDIEGALSLWRDSLDLKERIGDVKGKAATLHQMAGVIAQRGDIEGALSLWRDSLDLSDQIGDVKGKAATLHQMAGVIAQRGDIEGALSLWRDSLDLWDQIGDVKGKAATLNNMAWLADVQGDREQARTLYLQSAQALAAIHAWLDLTTVLGNLGALDEKDAAACLGQAFWLGLHVQVPLKTLLGVTAALLQKIGFGAKPAPLFASAAMMRVLAQGEEYPEAEQLQGWAFGLLGKCIEARGIAEEQFAEWLTGQRLNDPRHVFPVVEQALAELVGDGNWLFERTAVDKAEKYSTDSN